MLPRHAGVSQPQWRFTNLHSCAHWEYNEAWPSQIGLRDRQSALLAYAV